MPIEALGIFAYFNKQRFVQFGCGDIANWYGVSASDTKKGQALYPAMGRKHITSFGENKLVFDTEPSLIFKTINYFYVIVGTQIIQVDKFYNQRFLGNVPLGSQNWYAYLPVGNLVYVMITAGDRIFVITEGPGNAVSMQRITDPNAPTKPLYIGTFGNRFVVSQANTPDFYLTEVNLASPPTFTFDPNAAFTVNGAALVARASGVIGQIGVLHNQLYIFCDFTTDIWANIQSQITVAGQTFEFPFKLNSSYNWDYGIADPFSLSIDFGRMAWQARNTSGLVTFMSSNGQQPQDISTQAINVLLQNSTDGDDFSPFITEDTDGFLYQYENTIFYRVSAGPYEDFGELDIVESANALEFNFTTQTWGRVIELNGERNRIKKHVFFNNVHLVTVLGDGAIYQMAGNIYYNELRTPDVAAQDPLAFTKYPMRYELTTQQIYMDDYAEFITDYVEIDFVFGEKDFFRNNITGDNTIFIITEDAAPDGTPVFCIAEDSIDGQDVFLVIERGGNGGQSFDDNHYNQLYKPHIELYYSDDGGVTFTSADVREFSRLGQYRWRMRWYELGVSRNRAYRLIAVSSAPIVVLGAVQNVRRSSGGAN